MKEISKNVKYGVLLGYVEEGKPAPEVIIDTNLAAEVCGIGKVGLHGKVINPQYGTFLRWVYIITDAPLECDEPLKEEVCDGCGECLKACPGKAISKDGLDTWQCSVYYKGAHKSNPFMTDEFLKGHPAFCHSQYRICCPFHAIFLLSLFICIFYIIL